MIRGTTVTIAGRKFLLPPMNWATFQKHKAFLRKATSGQLDPMDISEDDMGVIFDVILLSMQRNYPDLTAEELAQIVDTGNMNELFGIAMKTSGFEELPAGESPPATSQTSTG